MPSLRQIRRRIRSVQNTAKVTKAMEMVAAAKFRRAQQRYAEGRPYAERMRGLLADLAAQPMEDPEQMHPLLRRHAEVKRVEVVHITPDRGLCGGLPGALNRRTGAFMVESRAPVTVIAVGKKGRDFMVRYGREVRAVFTDVGDRPRLADVLAMARLVIDDYTNGYADLVYLTYSQYISAGVQRPLMRQLLPIEPARLEASQAVGYIYEPRPLAVLSSLLPRFVEMQLYHAVLEGVASEQAARMVAMRNATDSALEMVDGLTLVMNKVRQESITKELLDIVGGVAGLAG